MKKLKNSVWLLILISNAVIAQSSEKKTTSRADAQKPVVFNYEADIIEGEKKRPELFLQTNTNDLSLDALVFLRKDFNDFHSVEKNRRPLFLGGGGYK